MTHAAKRSFAVKLLKAFYPLALDSSQYRLSPKWTSGVDPRLNKMLDLD